MSEKDRRVRTDPWSGVTYRLEAGENVPPRPHLSDTCLRFLNLHGAFEDQRQPGSKARDHIDGCPQCRQYIARKEWERKKEEELLSSPDVEALVAKYAKRFRVPFYQRRKFLAAASVLALGALGLGAKAWFGHSGPQTAGTTSVTADLDAMIARHFTDLDRQFAEGGGAAIAKVFSHGALLDVQYAIKWIGDRQHTSLIPLLVNALLDPRIEVRSTSLFALHRMPPLSVKPFQPALDNAASTESDPSLGTALQNFADAIRRAR